jgi:roadblock/LC7 domain-containing protein
MADLDELFQMDGVVAVAKIDDVGRIVDWKAKGVVTPEIKEETGKLIGELLSISNEMSRIAPRNWHPWHSWIFSGGEMIMILHGENAITLEAAKADINKILKTLGMFVQIKR